MRYPESDIRRACRDMGIGASTEEALLAKLKGDQVHAAWTDSDTVTVKELHDAASRQTTQLYSVTTLLDSIDEHREPEYPPLSVWKSADDQIWQRDSSGTWAKMGVPGRFAHSVPKRPLKRTDVI